MLLLVDLQKINIKIKKIKNYNRKFEDASFSDVDDAGWCWTMAYAFLCVTLEFYGMEKREHVVVLNDNLKKKKETRTDCPAKNVMFL